MRISPKIVLLLSAAALITSTYCIVNQIMQNKRSAIYVVDVMRLFNEFKMKRELESTTTARVAVIRQQVDSLTAVYNYMLKEKDVSAVENNRKILEKKTERARLDIESYNQKANEQIWTRLNGLVDEYGKKNNVKLIIGANGLGSVMYNDGIIDITDKMIVYVNSRYDGKVK